MKLFNLCLTALILSGTVITKAVATQKDNSKPIPIQLGFNAGTTITWADSNEVIEQIWLDNPTFATIDINGCVAGWKGCTESNAQIIHLKRNKDLKLKHLPFANSTLLTVVTKDMQTNRTRLHFYEIKKYNRTSNTLVVAARTPAPARSVARRETVPVSQFGLTPAKLATEMERAIAKVRKSDKPNRELIKQLNVFAGLLKRGTKEPHALALSGVSPELVKQILEVQ